MYLSISNFVDLVNTKDQAQAVIAMLLTEWSSDTAQERISDEARFAKQTSEEITSRTASNLLNSFVARKPGGFV